MADGADVHEGPVPVSTSRTEAPRARQGKSKSPFGDGKAGKARSCPNSSDAPRVLGAVPCGRASAPRARWARTLSERTAAKPRASLRSSPRTRCSNGLQTASPSDLDPLSVRPCQAAGMKPLDRSSAARRHVVVFWCFAPENCRLRRGVLPIRIESRQSPGGKIRATYRSEGRAKPQRTIINHFSAALPNNHGPWHWLWSQSRQTKDLCIESWGPGRTAKASARFLNCRCGKPRGGPDLLLGQPGWPEHVRMVWYSAARFTHPMSIALLMPPRWFGASVGGDMVWSFRPGAEGQTPPRTELGVEGFITPWHAMACGLETACLDCQPSIRLK